MGLLTLLSLALGSYLIRRSRRPKATLLDPNEKYLLRLLDKTVSCEGGSPGSGGTIHWGWDAPRDFAAPDLPGEMCVSSILQTVSHNTKRFRFALPTAHHILGLPVGKESVEWAPFPGILTG